MAIIDFFDRGWRSAPDAAAYVQDERAFSFREVGELSCRIAHALQAAGLGCGAKGARQMPYGNRREVEESKRKWQNEEQLRCRAKCYREHWIC